MGVSGLLQALRPITKASNLEEFRGKTAAVDTFGWLHKGAFCCSTEICMDNDARRCVEYCLRYVDMLKHFGVKPIMVFDGGYLPVKGNVEIERRKQREENMENGRKFYASGEFEKANACFTKAVNITADIALGLIKELEKRGVEFVVAPYEADAQIAYLCKERIADFALSEDSDCLAFGCETVFFKLDSCGNGQVIEMSRLQLNRNPNLAGFSREMFLDMCILSGCDYFEKIKGFGIKKAAKLVQKYQSSVRILRGLRFESSFVIPTDLEHRFYRARFAFRHHMIFTYGKEEIISQRLYELDTNLLGLLRSSDQDMSFAGTPLDDKISRGIAQGWLNPFTSQPYSSPISQTLSAESETLERKSSISNLAVISTFSMPSSPKMKKQESLPHQSIAHTESTVTSELLDEEEEIKVISKHFVTEGIAAPVQRASPFLQTQKLRVTAQPRHATLPSLFHAMGQNAQAQQQKPKKLLPMTVMRTKSIASFFTPGAKRPPLQELQRQAGGDTPTHIAKAPGCESSSKKNKENLRQDENKIVHLLDQFETPIRKPTENKTRRLTLSSKLIKVSKEEKGIKNPFTNFSFKN